MRSRLQREEDRAWTEQMVGAKRRWFTAVFGNGLLLAILLGLPFARGVWRAKETWPRYAVAASCLLGGKPTKVPGLGALPAVDAHFGNQVLRAWASGDSGWLARCDKALGAVVPEPAIFVWPPAKEGELRVREALRVLRAELAKVRGYRGESRVPHDPVRALLQLHRELEGHAELAGIIDLPPQTAVSFAGASSALTRPSRIPIYAGSDAVLTLWGNDNALSVVAVDRTGVSFLKAQSDEVQSVRHVRPPLLEGFTRADGQSYLLWALSREKCKSRSGGCEGKAMGISRVDMPLTKLTLPRWIASHPIGRLDRSVLPPSQPGGLWLLAAEGAARASELRGFALPEAAGGDVASELSPLRWTFSQAIAGEPLGLLHFAGESIELSARGESGGTAFVAREIDESALSAEGAAERVIGSLKTSDGPWAAYCADGQRAGLAFGTTSELVVSELEQGATKSWPSLALALGNVLHERDPVRDRVSVLCLPTATITFARSSDDKLWQISCGRDSATCTNSVVAERVTSFATLDTGSSLLLAYAGSDEQAQIRLQRFDRAGKPLGKAQIPSPCWDPRGGMCDQPRLHKLGARIVLSARDGTDLLALESPDDGLSWRSVGGYPNQF